MITFDNISDECLEDILNILFMLAKRKDDSITWWCNYHHENELLCCNICLEEFPFKFDDDRVLEHMLFHIKESNLAVFL